MNDSLLYPSGTSDRIVELGYPKVQRFLSAVWPFRVAKLIQDTIEAILLMKGECSVMLTGGRNAERVYAAWGERPEFQQLTNVCFYFGDERCVPPGSLESNYGMALRTLFQRGVPPNCSIYRIEADCTDYEAAAMRYARMLPREIDLLLLGVGEDGHIASLFPCSAVLQELERAVVPVIGPKPPFERITITPLAIRRARSVFILAGGAAKAAVLSKALESPDDVPTLPARLVLHATWLLDSSDAEPT